MGVLESNEKTPRLMRILRHRIIGAMLTGKIGYAEAMRLQQIKGNCQLTAEAARAGIETTTQGDKHDDQ